MPFTMSPISLYLNGFIKLIVLTDKSVCFILFHTVCKYVSEIYISEYKLVHIHLQFGIMSPGN